MRILFVPSADIKFLDSLEGTRTLLRCERAYELFQTGSYDYILSTGGRTHPPEVETKPAAITMAAWFLCQGVPVDRLLCEEESLDSFQNVHFSLALLRRRFGRIPGQRDICVVSQAHHTLRLAITFQLAHGIGVEREIVDYPLTKKEVVMECLYLAYHVYDRRGEGYLARRGREQRRRQAAGIIEEPVP